MIQEQAEALISGTLAPLATDEFFDAVGKRYLEYKDGPSHPRRLLFGDDPKQTALSAFVSHSEKLDWHARAPTQPPPTPRETSGPDDFRQLIQRFHERGYTVRIPDVAVLSPQLQLFTRALEFMLRKPVEASLFWSGAGAEAIIHYDKSENIVVQLEGRKRWYISTEPAGLQNNWMHVGEPVPSIEHHRVVDVGPGDLLYIPRGTPHTVESTTESLHLAIVFQPMTAREAIIAALDALSDNDRSLRETAVTRANGVDFGQLSAQVTGGIRRLLEHAQSEDFLRAALDFRFAQNTASLPPLPRSGVTSALTRETEMRQTPLAISYLRPSFASMDFSQPGVQIPIHRGVEPELKFITSNQQFRIGDIPGAAGDDVKIALVTRMIDTGFLEVAS